MSRKVILFTAVLVLAAVAANGCLVVGNSPKVYIPTAGQELLDLKSSLEQGAITPDEFELTKAIILKARRHPAEIKAW